MLTTGNPNTGKNAELRITFAAATGGGYDGQKLIPCT